MNTRLALTGALPFVIVLAALLSAPLCAWLLARYRRAVVAGMGQRTGAQPAPPPRHAPLSPPPPLAIDMLTAPPVPTPAWRHACRAPWRMAAVCGAAGVAYGMVMALTWLRAGGIEWLPLRTLAMVLVYAWPGVLAVLLVAAYDRRHRALLLGAYALLHMLPWWLVPPADSSSALLNAAVLWFTTNALPTVLVWAFMARRVRAVGPVVLSFMVVALMGSQLVISGLEHSEATLRAVSQLFFALGLGGSATFFVLLLLGMGAASLLFWPVLRMLGRRYKARRLSEQSLSVTSLFIVFAVAQAIPLAFNGAAWVLAGLVAFAAARLVMAIGWRALPRPPVPLPRLLLLRVFALGARGERLFQRLRRHWQPLGLTTMIAGPDLVTSTVEPHEFLGFLSGELARTFVGGPAELEARVAAFDARPSPDGQHRIEELFCRADTWQMAMQRLAADSSAVLMDLRSFAPGNDGCAYEIGRLLDSVDLRRVLLLVDGSTKLPHLHDTVQALWRSVAADSPNRRAGAALRVMNMGEPDHATLVALLGHLLHQADARA